MPTAGLLKSPLITLSLLLTGSSGSRVLPRFISSPFPPLALRPPVFAVDAVSHEHHRKPLRERPAGHRGVRRCPPHRDRFEPWQRHRDPDAAQDHSSRYL